MLWYSGCSNNLYKNKDTRSCIWTANSTVINYNNVSMRFVKIVVYIDKYIWKKMICNSASINYKSSRIKGHKNSQTGCINCSRQKIYWRYFSEWTRNNNLGTCISKEMTVKILLIILSLSTCLNCKYALLNS